jgi:hypothetical protein
MFQQQWCKLPEDGAYAKTYSSRITAKYTIFITVHFLVLTEFVINSK